MNAHGLIREPLRPVRSLSVRSQTNGGTRLGHWHLHHCDFDLVHSLDRLFESGACTCIRIIIPRSEIHEQCKHLIQHTPALGDIDHQTLKLPCFKRCEALCKPFPTFSTPTKSTMADVHPLNPGWPEKLPYQNQSLVLPGPGKPGHSGMLSCRARNHPSSREQHLSVDIYRNGKFLHPHPTL